MATIAIIKQRDAWEGLSPIVEHKKFIERYMMTYEGSAGYGGTEEDDPIQAAKDWAVSNSCDSDVHGFYLEVIDTQSPVGTSTHKKEYSPQESEENSYNLEWVLQ